MMFSPQLLALTLLPLFLPTRSYTPPPLPPHLANQMMTTSPSLTSKLSPSCPLGFVPSSGSPTKLVKFLQSEKISLEASQNSYVLVLCKVGDFYETYGVDSLLLTTIFSLQSMGGKLRSGFPLPNIQVRGT